VSTLPSSPYKGLSAFDDSDVDALLFFGREREREIVVANLIASRFTVLYGPSGVGKSSLLRAAVARSLRELPEQPFVVVFSRWGDDPAAALSDAVTGGEGATRVLGEALVEAQTDRDVYLILDQAEEYFLYHGDEAGPESFAEALPAALSAPLRVNVLVSLREDSLAKLDRFAGRIPGLFANTLRLDRLDRAAAQAAIVRPAERFGELVGEPVSVEAALVERVLDEVGTGRIESALGGLGGVEDDDGASVRIEAPYLQLVMQRLWEEERAQGSSVLRAETLERLGGAQHVVEEHLAGALAGLTEPQKDVAARLFNHLVTPSGTKIAHEVSDLAAFGDVSLDQVRPVLEWLAESRILRSLEEGDTVRYEIFHDVLAHPVLAWRARHRTERAVERQLEERHRRRSRAQRLAALGLVLAFVLVGALVFALVQQRNADEKAKDARASALDASAIALLPEDPELSLLLARESARLAPRPTSEDALLQSLLSSRVRATYDAGGPIVAAAFVPGDAPTVAFVDAVGTLRVIDVASGDAVATVDAGAGSTATPSADGTYVVVRRENEPPTIVELPGGETRCALDDLGGPAADAVPAGSRVVVVKNGVGSVWTAETCQLERTLGRVGSTAVRVTASDDGRKAAFLSGREARVFDLARPRQRVRRLVHPGEITSLAFGPGGDRIVTGGRDQLARLWNGRTGRRLADLAGHKGQVLDVAFSPLGTEVATASTDGTTRIWDAATGEFVVPLFGHTDFVRTVDFAPDGLSVVTSSDDGTARTWALNGRRLATFAGHQARVADAHFSQDGAWLVTVGEDGAVRVWDTGVEPDLVEADVDPPAEPTTEATSPDGSTTATAEGSTITLERQGGDSTELDGHRLAVTALAFSPNGRRLASASRDSDVILWDVSSGAVLRRLRGHFGAVSDARFSPDGRWIVSAGPRSVGLWRASDGRLIKLLVGPEGPFLAAGFGDDSRTIVARSDGDVVSTYDCRLCAGIPELLALADERLDATGRELTAEEHELYG